MWNALTVHPEAELSVISAGGSMRKVKRMWYSWMQTGARFQEYLIEAIYELGEKLQ